jgi:hypothetical protein
MCTSSTAGLVGPFEKNIIRIDHSRRRLHVKQTTCDTSQRLPDVCAKHRRGIHEVETYTRSDAALVSYTFMTTTPIKH